MLKLNSSGPAYLAQRLDLLGFDTQFDVIAEAGFKTFSFLLY
jgi:hypothetical protein